MATKFTPWLSDNVSADNCLTNDEYQSNGDRLYGFKPNDVASSKNVNSGLRLATLVASALMSMVDDAGTYDLTSSVTDISGAIEYYFDNRQYLIGSTFYRFSNRTMGSDHANVLNDNYCFAIGCGNTLTNENASSTNCGIVTAIGLNNTLNSNGSANNQCITIGSNNIINGNNCIAIGEGIKNQFNDDCLIIGKYNTTNNLANSSIVLSSGTNENAKDVLSVDNYGNNNVNVLSELKINQTKINVVANRETNNYTINNFEPGLYVILISNTDEGTANNAFRCVAYLDRHTRSSSTWLQRVNIGYWQHITNLQLSLTYISTSSNIYQFELRTKSTGSWDLTTSYTISIERLLIGNDHVVTVG